MSWVFLPICLSIFNSPIGRKIPTVYNREGQILPGDGRRWVGLGEVWEGLGNTTTSDPRWYHGFTVDPREGAKTMTVTPIGGRAGMIPDLGDEYSLDRIWKGASDRHGHSVQFRVTAPKHWQGRIEGIVQNPNLDYETHAEFIRDAISHRMHWAAEQIKDGQMQHSLGLEEMESVLAHYLDDHKTADRFKASLEDATSRARKSGDMDKFRGVIDQLLIMAPTQVREPMLNEILNTLEQLKRAIR